MFYGSKWLINPSLKEDNQQQMGYSRKNQNKGVE